MMIYIGLMAAFLTTFAGLPQLLQILKTKKTNDLSIYTLLMVIVGVILWLVYGIYLKDLLLILANSISLALQLTILYFKRRYDK